MAEVSAIAIDVGTTKVATSGGKVINTERVLDAQAGVAYVPHAYLETLVDLLSRIGKEHDHSVIVGFGHSVAGEYVNGKANYGYIGDPPNLKPTIIPERIEPLMNQNKIAENSAVFKLLGIMERQKLVTDIWGEGAEAQSIVFNGFMSLLAGKIANEKLPIFPDEWEDFKGLVNGGKKEDLPALFNLKPHQLELGAEQTVKLPGNKSVSVLKDLRADTWFLNRLYEKGILPSESMVFMTDSVIKMGWNLDHDDSNSLEGINYRTMHMGGNTGRNWVMPLTKQYKHIGDIGSMFSEYKLLLKGSSMPDMWFFNPRAHESKGGLWRRSGVNWLEVSQDELLRAVPAEEADEVIQAIGWGVGCGMYAQVPKNLKEVVLMGGLIGLRGKIQEGWSDVFVKTAPLNSSVWWLPVADSSKSAVYWLRNYLGDPINYEKDIALRYLGKGEGLGKRWLDTLADIQA